MYQDIQIAESPEGDSAINGRGKRRSFQNNSLDSLRLKNVQHFRQLSG
jgi:hypothetical protein